MNPEVWVVPENGLQQADTLSDSTRFRVPVTIIRAGSSRGIFLREDQLPPAGDGQDAVILHLFRGIDGSLADGLGGESAVLRKVAVVGRTVSNGIPSLRYAFAQVDASLSRLDRSVECGNIAAGVPLFGRLTGLLDPGEADTVRMELINTGIVVMAQWLDRHGAGGSLRLGFPAFNPDFAQLPLGAPILESSAGVPFSVVRGTNTYLLIRSQDFGLPTPLENGATTDSVFSSVAAIATEVQQIVGRDTTLKVCMVSIEPTRPNDVLARIFYPAEHRCHPGMAVTGATTLALARCIPGTVLSSQPLAGDRVTVHHPSGSIDLQLAMGPANLPSAISIDRSCRLILRGIAY